MRGYSLGSTPRLYGYMMEERKMEEGTVKKNKIRGHGKKRYAEEKENVVVVVVAVVVIVIIVIAVVAVVV
jgi:hypothetical protein